MILTLTFALCMLHQMATDPSWTWFDFGVVTHRATWDTILFELRDGWWLHWWSNGDVKAFRREGLGDE